VSALERAPVRLSGAREPGRVQVLDLMRVRTKRFRYVFLFGLEEGVLPRRSAETPFLPDERRAELDEIRGRRLLRPDQVARDRYLF
jgi:inactivated superfamily I helicase